MTGQSHYMKTFMPIVSGFFDGMFQFPDRDDLLDMLKQLDTVPPCDRAQPKMFTCKNTVQLDGVTTMKVLAAATQLIKLNRSHLEKVCTIISVIVGYVSIFGPTDRLSGLFLNNRS